MDEHGRAGTSRSPVLVCARPRSSVPTVSALAIVSPGFPDVPGGVTDHTARLQRHWRAAGHEVLVHGSRGGDPGALVAEWRAHGVPALLLQYVPFLYARRGLSRFPERLARAARAAGIRVAAFVHEPWVPPTRLPWLVLSPLQRRQLRRLLGVCHGGFTPVPAWRALLGPSTDLIYVGSTLGDPPPDLPSDPPLPGPVIFSPFAAGLNWSWILAAADAIAVTPRLTVVGADWEAARRHPALRRVAQQAWDWRGYQEASRALSLLARARLVLAPFIDGLTGRRTSALAALSVGAPLVSSMGPLFDPHFAASPAALAGTASDFADRAAQVWRSGDSPEGRLSRLAWYRAELDPLHWDERLLTGMLGRESP